MKLLLRYIVQKWLGIASEQCPTCRTWFFQNRLDNGSWPGYFKGLSSTLHYSWNSLTSRYEYIVNCGFGSLYDNDSFRLDLEKEYLFPSWFATLKKRTGLGPCDHCIDRMEYHSALINLDPNKPWGWDDGDF